MVSTLGCQVQGVPAFGDTVGAGYTPLPCRKCPVLSIWGWIFPPKPVQEHLLRRRITSPKNKTPQGRRGCSSKEQGGDDPPPSAPRVAWDQIHRAAHVDLKHRSSGFSISPTFG